MENKVNSRADELGAIEHKAAMEVLVVQILEWMVVVHIKLPYGTAL